MWVVFTFFSDFCFSCAHEYDNGVTPICHLSVSSVTKLNELLADYLSSDTQSTRNKLKNSGFSKQMV